MRRCLRSLLAIVLLIALPLPAWPVIIETTTGVKLKGYLVKEDAAQIFLRMEGSEILQKISRTKIKQLVQVVNPDRLEILNKARPQGFREYADELARHRDDPEARDMAIRLYLISAYLDRDKFGRSSLLKMADLARSPVEARAFRALAFLEDILHDPQTLASKVGSGTDASFDQFLKALKYYRRGKTKQALEAVRYKGAGDYFPLVPGLLSFKEFVRTCEEHPECSNCRSGRATCANCKGRNPQTCKTCNGRGWTTCEKCQGLSRTLKVPEEQLAVIVRLELLVESSSRVKLGGSQDPSWTDTLRGMVIGPAPVLSLENVTEFDPRLCLYRTGKWQRP